MIKGNYSTLDGIEMEIPFLEERFKNQEIKEKNQENQEIKEPNPNPKNQENQEIKFIFEIGCGSGICLVFIASKKIVLVRMHGNINIRLISTYDNVAILNIPIIYDLANLSSC